MKLLTRGRGIAALTVSMLAVAGAAAGTASAKTEHATVKTTVHRAIVKGTAGPVTRTFSFIGAPGLRPPTLSASTG